jgi:type I restriction enzyme M protein
MFYETKTSKRLLKPTANAAKKIKYSKRATLQVIVENDYNLNIPRYVDTFEEEEQIDIEAIAEELRSVAELVEATDAKIAAFCNELGISTPF